MTSALPPSSPAVPQNPTKRVYDGLNGAYDYFNRRLFLAELPRCLITMQRKSKAYGYFAGDRFGEIKGTERADEIALNPQHFGGRTTKETLSTLVHEMAHLWQHHFGKPGKGGYHNLEWAAKMKTLGLHPSETAAPGGKPIGHRVSHYIVAGGPFDLACDGFLKAGFKIPYGDLWADDEVKAKLKAKKRASKTKFTCPECQDSAWGKPDLHLICGDCKTPFIAETGDDLDAINGTGAEAEPGNGAGAAEGAAPELATKTGGFRVRLRLL